MSTQQKTRSIFADTFTEAFQEGNKLLPEQVKASIALFDKELTAKILQQQAEPEEQKAKKPVSMAVHIFGQPQQQQPGFQAKQAAWLASLGRVQR